MSDEFVIIQLDKCAFWDINEACSQCAHECIHLLHPIDTEDATYFEEGVAMYYEQKVRNSEYINRPRPILDPKYVDALNSVEALMKIDDNIVKKLRVGETSISKITKEQLQLANREIRDELCDSLLRKFYT